MFCTIRGALGQRRTEQECEPSTSVRAMFPVTGQPDALKVREG